MLTSTALLRQVNSPEDLRRLSGSQLRKLCAEIKEYIIDVVEEKGGHFSSPLGVVELTIALHKVFQTPKDLLVWDVGHQCYPHKIVTGRRDQFPTLRQEGGISGFCHREESEYDVFGAGHASTSISAAVGFAHARDLMGERHRVVAVIGDGALTGGLAYEGLNNAALLKSQFLIILNDNRMSISPTVGAVSHYLTRLVTNPLYNRIRDRIWNLTGKLPRGTGATRRLLHSVQEGLKTFLVPGLIFEELGIRYIGPIEGHDLDELTGTLERVKDLHQPAVVHVLTRKGSGKKEAEDDSLRYYSLAGKAAGNGQEPKEKAPDYSKVFGHVMCELAEKDRRVCAVVAAMREGTGLADFAHRFPDRFFDVGIAEEHAVTFAAGLAASGLRPVVAIYSTFLQRCYDMIVHDVALQKLPVVFCLDRAGVVGPDGPTHHGVFDLAYLQPVPRLAVASPKDGNELRHLLYTALAKWDGPMAIRYPKSSSLRFDPVGSGAPLDPGSWEVVSEGTDVFVLAVGPMVDAIEKGVRLLGDDVAPPTILNARFVKPLDEAWIGKLAAHGRAVVTVEEGVLIGGFGSTVASALGERGFRGTVHRWGIADAFMPHATRERLLFLSGLSPDALARKLAEVTPTPSLQGAARGR